MATQSGSGSGLSPGQRSGEFEYERYIHVGNRGGEYTQLAIGFDYEDHEELIETFKGLDWEQTKASYNPDYKFKSGRERAWTIGTNSQEVSRVRDKTGLSIPEPENCPINRNPFNSSKSLIKVHTYSESELDYECMRCGDKGVLSAKEYELVYKSAKDIRTELLLADNEITHYCDKCASLFHIPRDDRSIMSKAMGEPDTSVSTPSSSSGSGGGC